MKVPRRMVENENKKLHFQQSLIDSLSLIFLYRRHRKLIVIGSDKIIHLTTS